MLHTKIKQFILLLGFILPATWCGANGANTTDGFSHIQKESLVQGVPRSNSIQATLDGHSLSVVFLENLGQITVEVSSNILVEKERQTTPTPNGVIIYIPTAGNYTVTITLANGDVYYGGFEVTD